MELKDKLNIPSAVWLSSEKAWQIDPDELPLPSVGAEAIVKCPRQIAIVSTGMIFKMTEERRLLLSKSYGLVILDGRTGRAEAKSRRNERKANNLLTFMVEIARRTRHLLLGTATPIQTDVADLGDLMNILAQGVDFVLGDWMSRWRDQSKAISLITEGRNRRTSGTPGSGSGTQFRRPRRPTSYSGTSGTRFRCPTTRSSPTSPSARYPTRTTSSGRSSKTTFSRTPTGSASSSATILSSATSSCAADRPSKRRG